MSEQLKEFRVYYPLWGATFDSYDRGLIGGNVLACVPNPQEWRHIQNTDIWKERYAYDSEQPPGTGAPLCMIYATRVPLEEHPAASASRLHAIFEAELSHALLALRLMKSGWFLDPEYAERVYTDMMYNERIPGPYRQLFLAGIPEYLPPRYHLSIDELTINLEHSRSAELHWNLIWEYREKGRHSSADIAIENFHRSYGFNTGGSSKVAFLFTALDAILGGMSAFKIDRQKLHAPFHERLQAALKVASLDEYEDHAAWMNEDGRHIRNNIAHGNPAAVQEEAEQKSDYIRFILRILLLQYLSFSIEWAEQKENLYESLSIPLTASTKLAYNRCLVEVAKGNEAFEEFL